MKNKKLSTFVVITIMFVSTTSCSWTPVFTHKINIQPTIEGHFQSEVISPQTRLKLENIIREVAEDHGLKFCPVYPKILTPKSEIASYCMPDEGVLTLWLNAKQHGSKFSIIVSDVDRLSLFIASESERLRTILNDLLQRLNKDLPFYTDKNEKTYFSVSVCKDSSIFVREICLENENIFEK